MGDINHKHWSYVTTLVVLSVILYLIFSYFLGGNIVKKDYLVEILSFFSGLFFWLFFFSQFVLPLRRTRDRVNIFLRVILYILDKFSFGYIEHGPSIFIQNGRIHQRAQEMEKTGPGVIWLDTASAAVLRTHTQITRTVGPGIVFTIDDEYVAGAVDLHDIAHPLGPSEKENPFTMEKSSFNYEDIQRRRWQTSGLTRDGIEVIATMTVKFKIRADNNEGGTPFGYNPDSVYYMVTRNFRSGMASDKCVLSSLPSQLAVDVWREYLRKFKLDQLFEMSSEDETVLQVIEKVANERLDKPLVSELDDFGRLTGRQVESEEYNQLFKMGLKASLKVKHLHFPPEIDKKLVLQWATNWLDCTRMEREYIELERSIRTRKGKEEALYEFAQIATQKFDDNFPETKSDALQMLVSATFRGAIRNRELSNILGSELQELSNIIQWLREHEKRGANES